MHDQIPAIVKEAREAAYEASRRYFNDVLGGRDALLCGFAYVYICDIKGNTKVGKALAAEGIKKGYSGAFEMYHPSGFPCQNIDTLEAGAEAAAEVFRNHGLNAYATSRLD